MFYLGSVDKEGWVFFVLYSVRRGCFLCWWGLVIVCWERILELGYFSFLPQPTFHAIPSPLHAYPVVWVGFLDSNGDEGRKRKTGELFFYYCIEMVDGTDKSVEMFRN